MLFLRLFMRRVLPAPLAELFELDFALDFPFVFARPIIYSFANLALHLYQVFLRHIRLLVIPSAARNLSRMREIAHSCGILRANALRMTREMAETLNEFLLLILYTKITLKTIIKAEMLPKPNLW